MSKARGKKSPLLKSAQLEGHKHLGDIVISKRIFQGLEGIFEEFSKEAFKKLNHIQKLLRVNRTLLQLILDAKETRFLLSCVIDYIDRITQEKVLEIYAFSHFELWLNQFSALTPEENYRVRALVAGKYLPREEYQLLFPIGMGKTYPGSHYVTAHSSPDLDTTIASFWGWVDAFAARVADGLHLWNVPGGASGSQVEIELLFNQIFGSSVFVHLAKTRTTLALSSLDLMNQKGLVKKHLNESTLTVDHERNQHAIILIDPAGYYLGDWRNFDVEGVRQIIMLLNQCLRWFENNLHVKLISLFAKETLSLKDLPPFIRSVFGTRIKDCEPAIEFTKKQKQYLEDYLCKVLGVKNGLGSTFEEFAFGMKGLSISYFQEFIDLVDSLQKSTLFDKAGNLIENRPHIFHYLEKIIMGLDLAIQTVRTYVERFDVALNIKTYVFGYLPQVVSYRAEVDEIRSKIGSYPYLTVTSSDKDGGLIPLGIIQAADLHKPILGTVSLRDFCNREEAKIPSYLEVISVIDHHKSSISTLSPSLTRISDVQSSNVILAELAFEMNDRYSTNNMSLEEIEAEMQEVKKDLSSNVNKRILQRLLQRQMVAQKQGWSFFIDPEREFVEYLHFLYAILDDTDLLTKVTYRDVMCVTSLLNRLKSLMLKKEVEILSFDDLPRDDKFVRQVASEILQNSDMYSLYRKIYLAKENSVGHNFELCVKGLPSNVFVDTKEQNGCCRVGQTKIFTKNYPMFQRSAPQLRAYWYEEARAVYKEHNEVDLHLHMISTIAGAEDLFAGEAGKYTHQDELWIWIPSSEQAIEHLHSFLNSFRMLPQVVGNEMQVAFLGDNARELDQIFSESFLPIPRHTLKDDKLFSLPIAVLRYKAGSINSRKAIISPCLPNRIN